MRRGDANPAGLAVLCDLFGDPYDSSGSWSSSGGGGGQWPSNDLGNTFTVNQRANSPSNNYGNTFTVNQRANSCPGPSTSRPGRPPNWACNQTYPLTTQQAQEMPSSYNTPPSAVFSGPASSANWTNPFNLISYGSGRSGSGSRSVCQSPQALVSQTHPGLSAPAPRSPTWYGNQTHPQTRPQQADMMQNISRRPESVNDYSPCRPSNAKIGWDRTYNADEKWIPQQIHSSPPGSPYSPQRDPSFSPHVTSTPNRQNSPCWPSPAPSSPTIPSMDAPYHIQSPGRSTRLESFGDRSAPPNMTYSVLASNSLPLCEGSSGLVDVSPPSMLYHTARDSGFGTTMPSSYQSAYSSIGATSPPPLYASQRSMLAGTSPPLDILCGSPTAGAAQLSRTSPPFEFCGVNSFGSPLAASSMLGATSPPFEFCAANSFGSPVAASSMLEATSPPFEFCGASSFGSPIAASSMLRQTSPPFDLCGEGSPLGPTTPPFWDVSQRSPLGNTSPPSEYFSCMSGSGLADTSYPLLESSIRSPLSATSPPSFMKRCPQACFEVARSMIGQGICPTIDATSPPQSLNQSGSDALNRCDQLSRMESDSVRNNLARFHQQRRNKLSHTI